MERKKEFTFKYFGCDYITTAVLTHHQSWVVRRVHVM